MRIDATIKDHPEGVRLEKRRMGVITDANSMHQEVTKYYGETLSKTEDLKTNACLTSGRPHPILAAALKNVPDEVLAKYYGCGSAVPFGIEGLRLLDLGCGSGRDCYAAAQFVGPKGGVVGVDMTQAQLDVAQRNLPAFLEKVPNATKDVVFRLGKIEDLKAAGIPDASVDIVVSNCVVNLSPDKEQVIKEVFRVLKQGGEFFFSDVYCDRRLPEHIQRHVVLVGECIGGALYVQDFIRICRKVGFPDVRVVKTAPVTVNNPELQALLGNAKFTSITYRLFKIEGMEDACEDFGQVATYRGTLPAQAHSYVLDDHHVLETGRPMLVCGNTAKMVGESWLRPHFVVAGDMSTHFGAFPCGPNPSPAKAPDASAPACSTGGCC